jgi:hypothetical protein
MATGRIGVTPTLRTRWSKQPTAGTTSLSGLDDNSVALVYDVGYEAVYRNGALLSRGNDYTATDGTTVTLIDATLAGDIIEILANQLVPLTDAISKGQFNAKGALLSATAASTPGVLAVGSNGQYLSADSTASTGLAWASVSAGANYTLLNAGGTALTGADTITVSGISGANKIIVRVTNASSTSGGTSMTIRFNSNTSGVYTRFGGGMTADSTYDANIFFANGNTGTSYPFGQQSNSAGAVIAGGIFLDGCNTSGVKLVTVLQGANANSSTTQIHNYYHGVFESSATISSVSIISSSGNFDAGTIYVYTSA